MLHSKQMTVTLIVLVLAAVLAACSGERPGASVDLDGTEWVLTALNGSSLVEGSNITLTFAEGPVLSEAEGRVTGFAGCNSYGGEYTAAEGALTISEIAITVQLCQSPEGIMEQEYAYTEALRNAAAYRVMDDRLEVVNAGGETTLVFTKKEELSMDPRDLVGTQWQLLSMDGRGPIEGSTITIVFHNENEVSGSAGCRGYVATYEASGDDIKFPWLAMTGDICTESEALMEQEGEYTTILQWASDYRLGEEPALSLSKGQLEILTARGETLAFEPLPEDADASLEGTIWVLTAFIEEKMVEEMAMPLLMVTDLLAETEITATFEDGIVSGSAGCNTYYAAYAFDGPFFTFETLAATEMACSDPAGVMEQEQRYLGFLEDMTVYRIYGSQLWLETGDGRALVFAAVGIEQTPLLDITATATVATPAIEDVSPSPTTHVATPAIEDVSPSPTTHVATPEATPSPQAVLPTNTPTPDPSTYLGVVRQGGRLGNVWNLADVRYGLQPDRLRVVVEMAEARDHVPMFQVVEVDNTASPFPTGHDPSWGVARIDLVVSDLYARNSPIIERLPLTPPDDPRVTRIGRYPTFDDASLGFSIGLKAVSAYEVYELTDPVRIVIDVLYGSRRTQPP